MELLESLSRVAAEDFLILEASLLNEWKLDEWRALFTEDCRYLVPNTNGDPYASPESSLFLIADDGHHLTERVKRLNKKTAHAEFPRSRTRRFISNVRILEQGLEQVKVESSFITYRASQGVTDTFYGRHEHCLVERGNQLRILEKRTILDMETLRPQGRLSIIV